MKQSFLDIICRALPQNWNDTLALTLLIIIPALWALNGKGIVNIGESVNGALIVTWTLIVQFYFRQRPPKD